MASDTQRSNLLTGAARRHSLDRKVERSRYAAARTEILRLRTSDADDLVLHWLLIQTPTSC